MISIRRKRDFIVEHSNTLNKNSEILIYQIVVRECDGDSGMDIDGKTVILKNMTTGHISIKLYCIKNETVINDIYKIVKNRCDLLNKKI
jgi:hypothetical protein